MQINFISSKDSGEIHTMNSELIEIMMGSETDDITGKFLNIFCKDIKKI